MQDVAKTELLTRLGMVLIGAIAGLSMWALVEYLPDLIDNHRFYLLISSVSAGFFVLLLALLGVLQPRQAFGLSAFWAMVAAALLYWNSAGFVDVEQLLDTPFSILAWILLLKLGAPFGAAALQGRARDYTYLFDTSWGIVVRYLAAWVFVGLFWALLMLSDQLLGIVGITVIEDLIDLDPVPYALTGAVLGLALAVAQDLNAYISPYLVLRLLRLLLPMLLVVVLVFILALPLQGLSSLFGSFSAAGIVMGIAIAGITLITSALDRDQDDAIASRFMIMATKVMALVLPILAGLAVWAIWLRVSDYGWTPERLAASVAAAFVLAYAVLYALSVLRGADWAKHIRNANIALAVTVMGVAVLWLTPVLNAQKISANHQVKRYLTGVVQAKDFPAWEIQNAWGVAGQSAAQQLLALPAEAHSQIIADLTLATDANKYSFQRDRTDPDRNEEAKALANLLTVLPEGRSLPADSFTETNNTNVENWAKTCAAPDTSPCYLIFGPFQPYGQEAALLIVPGSEHYAGVYIMPFEDGGFGWARRIYNFNETGEIDPALLDQLTAGNWRIAPSSRQSLWIGETEISPNN